MPETTFALHAEVGGRYTLHWEISDVAGRVLQTHDKTVAMKAHEDADITLSLAMPELGWYGLRITLSDEGGQALIKHEAAFALLGKDTRTAGYESPFGIWWFGNAHYATSDINVAGPMMFKAGMRRTTPYWTKATEADLYASILRTPGCAAVARFNIAGKHAMNFFNLRDGPFEVVAGRIAEFNRFLNGSVVIVATSDDGAEKDSGER